MAKISVENISKAYKHYPSRWARLAEWIMPFHRPRHHLRWILRDVSFDVNPGEAIGVIGTNGAGKSTLLKIITGTTQSTTGAVRVNGRIAALLELGMGFHPDFTGRQNVFMAGQLLGYSKEDLLEQMPNIESFAGIGHYIDQPVRVYSSGMQVRLAFSVATAIRPAILVVDEALAVGDLAFQRKCFARIEEFKRQGTTLLFVSHDTELIKRICDRAMLLHGGKLIEFGEPKRVVGAYERILFDPKAVDAPSRRRDGPENNTSSSEQYGSGIAQIGNLQLENFSGAKTNNFNTEEKIIVTYEVSAVENIADPVFSIMVKTREGICVYYADSINMDVRHEVLVQGKRFKVKWQLENNLSPGAYFINCAVRSVSGGEEVVHARIVDADMFLVRAADAKSYPGGLANLRCKLSLVEYTL